MPAYCGQWTRIGELTDQTLVVPLRCRSWACPTCGPRNKRRLLKRMSSVPVTTLITLTCSRRFYTSPDAAFRALSAAVPLLVKRIHRRWPAAPFQYLLVWERTKAGWPHAHLLARAPYIPQPWLSRTWAELTRSPVVDIRRVHTAHGATHYVAKYLAKDPQAPSPMKRYRASQAFFPEPGGLLGRRPSVGGVWHTLYQPWPIALLFYPTILYTIEHTPHGTIICTPRSPPAHPHSPTSSLPPRYYPATARALKGGLVASGLPTPQLPLPTARGSAG